MWDWSVCTEEWGRYLTVGLDLFRPTRNHRSSKEFCAASDGQGLHHVSMPPAAGVPVKTCSSHFPRPRLPVLDSSRPGVCADCTKSRITLKPKEANPAPRCGIDQEKRKKEEQKLGPRSAAVIRVSADQDLTLREIRGTLKAESRNRSTINAMP